LLSGQVPKVFGSSHHRCDRSFLAASLALSFLRVLLLNKLVGLVSDIIDLSIFLLLVVSPAQQLPIELFHGQVPTLVGIMVLEYLVDIIIGDAEPYSLETLLKLIHRQNKVDWPAEIIPL